MMNKRFQLLALAATWSLAAAATAQVAPAIEIHATITGSSGNGDGKCTAEVSVENSAEVEITDDLGVLRTITGAPAEWRHLECTDPLPYNMVDFSFRARDGRGRQSLARDPRTNGGRAIVRIDDPKGGRDTYRFEISWRGGTYRLVRGKGIEDEPARRGDINYSNRGEGSFHSRDSNDKLIDAQVVVRGQEVSTTFHTPAGSALYLTGRIVSNDGHRLIAEMSNSSVAGRMFIDTERGRVKNISMSSPGRRGFELSWHE